MAGQDEAGALAGLGERLDLGDDHLAGGCYGPNLSVAPARIWLVTIVVWIR